MTRIRKGKQSGDLWDKVILDNGMIGYVFQNYLKEVPNVEISSIDLNIDKTTINKNETIKLNIMLTPEQARNNKVIYKSSNTSVAIVDDTGNILGVSSGTADIMVSSENGKILKSITISVYSPVEDVYIDSNDLILKEGQTFKLNAIIFPEDSSNKTVSWNSSNTDIATIDENGNITALTEGTITIKVITEDGQKEKSINLKVMQNLEGTEIIFDENLRIEGNIISKLDYTNNTFAAFKDNITTNFIIEAYNYKNELLEDSSNLGTESKIVFRDDNNDIAAEYSIVLYGDINGDGKINSIDLLILQRHILKIQRFEGLFLKAGNISKNGKNPSASDSLKIQRHILKLEIIGQ